MIVCRPPLPDDWDTIAYLASHGGFDVHWVANRRAADAIRREVVAEAGGEVIGYGAIERRPAEPKDYYRVFVVTDWSNVTIGPRGEPAPVDQLFVCVEQMLRQAHAARAWMRELASDRKLLQFMQDRGFVSGEPYAYGGRRLVNLTKDY